MHVGINAHLLAFSSNYRQAGLSRYIYELLTNLPKVAPHSRYTAFVSNERVPADFRRAARGVRLSRSRFPTMRAPIRIGWEQAVLPLAAARARLDLLHCPVNVRPLASPCPTIITIHDLIFLRYPQNFHPAKQRYLSTMTGWSARHAAHVITVSEATRRDVIDLLGVDPDRVTTVHNGVGGQFKPVEESRRTAFIRDKGLTGRAVLYVGTLEPRKNITTLLHAFHAISDDPALEDVTLIIGGSKGWYYDEIFHTAKQLGLLSGGRVRFLGRVPDEELPLWYNIASVFAYPSVYEGFGLPPLEAMACGAPVITSNRSSLPEVVGDAGVLLDPEDVWAWAGALRQLLSDEQAAEKLRELGPRQAGKFGWERAARETAAIYGRVMNRAKPK